MRSCCGDATLADDLAQQVFLRVWVKIHTLRKASAFNAWLKRVAITVWLQYLRKNDALRDADQLHESDSATRETQGMGLDLDQALATLPATVRLCIILSYQEGMSHREIAEVCNIPLGTVKSHINRGAQKLQDILALYDKSETERQHEQ